MKPLRHLALLTLALAMTLCACQGAPAFVAPSPPPAPLTGNLKDAGDALTTAKKATLSIPAQADAAQAAAPQVASWMDAIRTAAGVVVDKLSQVQAQGSVISAGIAQRDKTIADQQAQIAALIEARDKAIADADSTWRKLLYLGITFGGLVFAAGIAAAIWTPIGKRIAAFAATAGGILCVGSLGILLAATWIKWIVIIGAGLCALVGVAFFVHWAVEHWKNAKAILKVAADPQTGVGAFNANDPTTKLKLAVELGAKKAEQLLAQAVGKVA